jgi:hypothetical protein
VEVAKEEKEKRDLEMVFFLSLSLFHSLLNIIHSFTSTAAMTTMSQFFYEFYLQYVLSIFNHKLFSLARIFPNE